MKNKYKTLAASPIVKNDGKFPRRVILRVSFGHDDTPEEFVVHDEHWQDSLACFGNGDYFRPRTSVMEEYRKALARFYERSAKLITEETEYDEAFGPSVLSCLTRSSND